MTHEVLDLPGTPDDADLGAAVAGLDRILRWGLAAAWLGLSVLGAPAALLPEAPLRVAFTLVGLAALFDPAPRLAAPAGLAVSLAALPAGAALAPWLALVAAAGARARLHLGPAGHRLAGIRRLRRATARGVAAMEIRRARAAELPEKSRDGELSRAGDAFERAGRASAALRALGVGTAGTQALARSAGRTAARLPSGPRDALLARLD